MNKREKVFKKTNGKCAYCGCNLEFYNFHIDHKKAKSKLTKDKNNIRNLFPACVDCNLLKGSLDIDDFREKIEGLIYDNSRGRTIAKFYEIKPHRILFYFEEMKDKRL